MTRDLKAHVLDRLIETGVDNEEWSLLVLAALDGADALGNYLGGRVQPQRPPGIPGEKAESAKAEPPGVYVSSITVEGFRGIGPACKLTLPPGPGLTLVVGRNGSGKSSFAEGLEVLLTGDNYRWHERNKAWRESWRNLHHPSAAIKADLIVEGNGTMTVTRTWDDEDMDEATVRAPGQPPRALDTLGWTQALATFRPFLSYNELGSLLEEGPSKLYDALSGVLGLDALVDLQNVLAGARKARADMQKDATDAAKRLIAMIRAVGADSSDPRFAAALRALDGRTWDLGALEALVAGDENAVPAGTDLLRGLQLLPRPNASAVGEIAAHLRAAAKAFATFAGSDVERKREHARLLRAALSFHAKHEPTTCPVCGTNDILDAGWHNDAQVEVDRLDGEAAAYAAAESELTRVFSDAQRLIESIPVVLAQAADVLSLDSIALVRRLWREWAAGREIQAAPQLADHLESRVLELAEAIGLLVDEAAAELKTREDTWRPVREAIAAWLPKARAALATAVQVDQIKKAEKWLKEAGQEIRDERFKPIAERAIAVWKTLRLQSNVDLGAVELEGTATSRRVQLKVTVDNVEADALGVMSQGELHSLALSLFLPRATLPESPFRFISVDDPVQSMDPTRVAGLARALADTAKTRQVIVFTHDDRLPEAARLLGIPATVIGVSRRIGSQVDARQQSDPITAYLDDARAVLNTKDLPREVAPRVVPGFCRAALESACMTAIRRTRLKGGQPHDAIEQLLLANGKLYPLMALALFDDESKTTDVLSRLNNIVTKGGMRGADAFKACNLGAHEVDVGLDAEQLFGSVRQIANYLLKAPA